MSRFSHKIDIINKNTGKSSSFQVDYGYDRPLSEYFVQVYDLNGNVDEEDGSPILWEGNRTSGKSNSEMLALFIILGIPKEHCDAVLLDIEF